jgi:transcriptional regulator with XRE-family HTH domain
MFTHRTQMRLRKERKAARLTQAKLGRLARVPQGTISKMERGELLAPTFSTLDRLATVLRRFGRSVQPGQIQPRRQPALIKGFRNEPKQRKGAA